MNKKIVKVISNILEYTYSSYPLSSRSSSSSFSLSDSISPSLSYLYSRSRRSLRIPCNLSEEVCLCSHVKLVSLFTVSIWFSSSSILLVKASVILSRSSGVSSEEVYFRLCKSVPTGGLLLLLLLWGSLFPPDPEGSEWLPGLWSKSVGVVNKLYKFGISKVWDIQNSDSSGSIRVNIIIPNLTLKYLLEPDMEEKWNIEWK